MISAAQVLFSVFVVESPAWLGRNGQLDKKKAAAKRLWGSDRNYLTITIGLSSLRSLLVPSQRNEDDPLLDELEARREATPVNVVTVPQLLAARELWKPLAIISLAMASQQLSGMYYCGVIMAFQ